ncbi:MAG: hypothetical protein KKE44_25035 [Proteobacteria bacterium]|nr:hypothetical protein [Pseudomonadota bacterium]MBU1585996.1 hypothetical protein [Pseudomonadota bacterium]MBU2452648.1 hypothetical protein [Pseudomonadota bacterium]MBU2630091.1 hypothetical protein [Pseudomonadota bacterium]
MQDIHDIRPPVPVGFDPMILKIIFMVLGGILVLVLLFFLVKKWLKKRKQPQDLKHLPQPLAPYAAALKELDLLSQRELLVPRLFYFDLTAVLRKYIGRSFGINAIEMTSQEFIKHMNRLDLVKTVKTDISLFLNRSDPFKYAGTSPEKDGVKADLLFIRELIHQIEKNQTSKKNEEEQ